MKRVHVCTHRDKDGKGCPNLTPCPIPGHSRPANARWSKDRDGAAQHRFRKAVLNRDGHRCVRCGATQDLVAHHVRPGYTAADGITLCDNCHKTIDSHAR